MRQNEEPLRHIAMSGSGFKNLWEEEIRLER